MDLRHPDPRMARDHDLRVMPGPPQLGMGGGMGMGMPGPIPGPMPGPMPVPMPNPMPGQPLVRPPQPMTDMDA